MARKKYSQLAKKVLLGFRGFCRAQPDITSGSGCPGIFKCPDSRLPVFFPSGLRLFNTFKVQEKPQIYFSRWLLVEGKGCHLFLCFEFNLTVQLTEVLKISLLFLKSDCQVGGRGKVSCRSIKSTRKTMLFIDTHFVRLQTCHLNLSNLNTFQIMLNVDQLSSSKNHAMY